MKDLKTRIEEIVGRAVDRAVRVVVAEKQSEIDALTFERDEYRGLAGDYLGERDVAFRQIRVYRYAAYAGFAVSGGSIGWGIGSLRGAGIGLGVGVGVALLVDIVTQMAAR